MNLYDMLYSQNSIPQQAQFGGYGQAPFPQMWGGYQVHTGGGYAPGSISANTGGGFPAQQLTPYAHPSGGLPPQSYPNVQAPSGDPPLQLQRFNGGGFHPAFQRFGNPAFQAYR